MNPLIIVPIVLISFIAGYGLARGIFLMKYHSGFMAIGYDEEDNQAVYQLFMEKHPYKVAKGRYIVLDVKIGEYHREKNTSYYEDNERSLK